MDQSITTRSSARRTSILKPPKPHHPLQNINFNNSSEENSLITTTKLKRRVSFAEKKHVKEFCNSVEQGTVWDDTYEEHDLSNLKSNASTQKDCEVNGFSKPLRDTLEMADNSIVQENTEPRLNYNQAENEVDCDLDFTNATRTVQATCEAAEKENVFAFDSELEEKRKSANRLHEIITVYEDSDDNLSPKVSTLANRSMDFTEIVSNILHSNAENVKPFENNSVEFTEPVLASINLTEIGKNQAGLNFCEMKGDRTATAQSVLNKFPAIAEKENIDILMEETETLPTVTRSTRNFNYAENKTRDLNDVSMEMTTAVDKIGFHSQQEDYNRIGNCKSNVKLLENEGGKTVFLNDSMDFTKPIKIRKFDDGNLRQNLDAARKKIEEAGDKINATCAEEKTMEITKAIVNSLNLMEKYQGCSRILRMMQEFENDEAVCDKAMELTEVLTMQESSAKNNNRTICSDEAMEFTAVLPGSQEPPTNFNKTVYNNRTMELTAALTNTFQTHSSTSNYDKPTQNCSTQQEVPIPPSSYTVCHNNSTTKNTIVSSLNGTDDNKSQNIENADLNTSSLLPTISMDISEALELISRQCNKDSLINNDRNESKTDIIAEKSVHQTVTNSIVTEKIEEPTLLEILVNKTPPKVSSNLSAACDVSGDFMEISPSISNVPLNEKTYIIDKTKNLKGGFAEEQIENKIEVSVNSSSALHAFASGSKENNTITFAANSALEDRNCFQHAQNTKLHSRRTYTIKRLSNECVEKNRSLEANSDSFCYNGNKENSMEVIAKEIEASENLEAIEPPSFLYLDRPLSQNSTANASCDGKELDTSVNHFAGEKRTHLFESIEGNSSEIDNKNHCAEVCIESQSNDSFESQTENESDKKIESRAFDNLGSSNINSTNTKAHILDCTAVVSIEQPVIDVREELEDVQKQNEENSTIEKQNTENLNVEHSYAENSNAEVKNRSMDCAALQYEEFQSRRDESNAKGNLEPKESEALVSLTEIETSIELDPFSLLIKELKACALSDNIIWEVYHENIEKKLFVIGFISSSLLLVIYLKDEGNVQCIKDIKIFSRLADDAEILSKIVHNLVLSKFDPKQLMNQYETSAEVFLILDHVSKEIKLAMDFMFDLEYLDDCNLMDINCESISFMSLTKKMDIILRVTVNVKPFHEIEPQDVSVKCLLGSVRENDIKKLIINVKKDHKFLRRFMSDVRDYIYLMEESNVN